MPTPTRPHVDTAALARRLNSADEAERRHAQAELQSLIAADVARIRHVYTSLWVCSLVFAVVCMAAWHSARQIGQGGFGDYTWLICAGLYGLYYLLSLPIKQAAKRIAALDIPQAVGPLIEAHCASGLFRSRHIKAALIQLLPRLQATDAGVFTLRQRKYLYQFLTRDNYLPYYGSFWGADLKIAILRALEQIGDEKAVPHVQKLSRSAHDAEVRRAAWECLPFLQQRAEQTRVEQTLLRASAPTAAPDMLLRPAVATSPTDPQVLLRAASADTDNS